MKDLDPIVMLAVFQEMLGTPLLWLLIALTVAGALAFVGILARERRIVAARMVRSQAAGMLGGLLALWLMARVSSSGFTDAGGPIDWLLIAAVFVLGMIGGTILLYSAAGWIGASAACRRKP